MSSAHHDRSAHLRANTLGRAAPAPRQFQIAVTADDRQEAVDVGVCRAQAAHDVSRHLDFYAGVGTIDSYVCDQISEVIDVDYFAECRGILRGR